jgi:hypothetical protein
MVDFPNKAGGAGPPKSGRPKPEPMVSGTKAKRPMTRRFRDALFTDNPKALGQQIGKDILVPRLKMGVQEALNSMIAGMLWGNISQQPSIGQRVVGNVLRPNTPYSQLSSSPHQQQAQQAVIRSTGNYENVICPTEQEAAALLAGAMDYLAEYQVMAVGDLYEMARIPTQVSDAAYGWHSLQGARIIQHAVDQWEVKLPPPSLL